MAVAAMPPLSRNTGALKWGIDAGFVPTAAGGVEHYGRQDGRKQDKPAGVAPIGELTLVHFVPLRRRAKPTTRLVIPQVGVYEKLNFLGPFSKLAEWFHTA